MLTKTPWGYSIKLWHSRNRWVKILIVLGRTSLHKHCFRDEHFFSFFGYRYVERGCYHRQNSGVYLEYSTGKPRESDVYRLEDDYGRV